MRPAVSPAVDGRDELYADEVTGDVYGVLAGEEGG